jgi:hypothetical protein
MKMCDASDTAHQNKRREHLPESSHRENKPTRVAWCSNPGSGIMAPALLFLALFILTTVIIACLTETAMFLIERVFG